MLTLLFLSIVSAGANSSECQTAIRRFLAAPSDSTFAALAKENDADCWAGIQSTSGELDQLNRWVAHGNPWAAQYSAKHLKRLNGGEQKDALMALGQFSHHDMERLLFFAKQGLLSKRELSGALTMLPREWSGKPNVQLACLEQRRSKVARVNRPDLQEQRREALRAIDDSVSAIQSKH